MEWFRAMYAHGFHARHFPVADYLKHWVGTGKVTRRRYLLAENNALTLYDPQPRVEAAIRDSLSICSGSPLSSSLPRGIGHRPPAVPLSAGQASGRRRSFRHCGAAISSAPCRACACITLVSCAPHIGDSFLSTVEKEAFPS